MSWDPAVLRKYNTTGHFKLINQLRSELREKPLVRPKQGETVGDANRSKALIRVLEARRQGGTVRSRRGSHPAVVANPAPDQPLSQAVGFRDRLDAVDLC